MIYYEETPLVSNLAVRKAAANHDATLEQALAVMEAMSSQETPDFESLSEEPKKLRRFYSKLSERLTSQDYQLKHDVPRPPGPPPAELAEADAMSMKVVELAVEHMQQALPPGITRHENGRYHIDPQNPPTIEECAGAVTGSLGMHRAFAAAYNWSKRDLGELLVAMEDHFGDNFEVGQFAEATSRNASDLSSLIHTVRWTRENGGWRDGLSATHHMQTCKAQFLDNDQKQFVLDYCKERNFTAKQAGLVRLAIKYGRKPHHFEKLKDEDDWTAMRKVGEWAGRNAYAVVSEKAGTRRDYCGPFQDIPPTFGRTVICWSTRKVWVDGKELPVLSKAVVKIMEI